MSAANPDRPSAAGSSHGHGFGTAPVFLASSSTILGAVLFLRFGYAVGHIGATGTLLVILLGHLVTVPTALAIAEIATNRRVEGGGEYFIISRSFGTTIGAAIGVSLYLSQAVSVAFYMIAFAEAFRPVVPWVESTSGVAFDARFVSLPATVLMAALVLVRGASIGVKALWVVVSVLAVSLAMFFLGGPVEGVDPTAIDPLGHIPDGDPFMLVFAIVFPAFTGMTAGVGLSGDLANPRRSIPLGILSATAAGMVVYLAVVWKLAVSAPPELLATDQLVMSRIALWGPIIPIGLACATISSAIGSILIAPRTLQALAADRILPVAAVNRWLSRGTGETEDPRNGTLVTAALALVTVAAGDVDFVARIISMFFMVTYGALCAISFLEHFAARPSYRPAFRSRWYLSLLGAVMCLFLMFQMDPLYSIVAIVVMVGLYSGVRAARRAERDDLTAIFQGVMTQATRRLQVRLQKSLSRHAADDWRPSLIMVNGRTFTHAAPIQMFGWLSHRFGFGTYLHFIEGPLDAGTYAESRDVLQRLIRLADARGSGIYVDTMISPSMRSALAQSIQVPGISGMENNTILLEFARDDVDEALDPVREGCELAGAARLNRLVLRHGDHFFGDRDDIHVWLTWHDYDNASLMVLLAYILLGHPDWHRAEIRVFAAFPQAEVDQRRMELREMVSAGRLPISDKNVRIIPTDEQVDFDAMVERTSRDADLVLLGFTGERLSQKGTGLFRRHPSLRDVLFVSATERIGVA